MSTEHTTDLGTEQEAIERLMERMDAWNMNIAEKDPEGLEKREKEVFVFAHHLREAHPDYDSYRLYHVLIGGSYDPTKHFHYDFPGEDSIEVFIETKYK